jgi:ATP-dependent helicase/nuclease subunit B
MTALNICSFKQKLYLSYPSSIGGEERASSRIIAYAKALFKESGGNGDNLVPYNARLVARSANALPYYSSRPLPALKQIFKGSFSGVPSAIYAVLCNSGYGEQADKIMGIEEDVGGITCGKRLYGGYVSPTALETYFDCPYKSFLSRGLKLSEREEGVIRPLDTGNFIHTVLQKLADKINKTKDKDEFAAIAKSEAENLIKDPAYSALSSSKRGQYIGRNLIYESVQISLGMFEQVKNSNFVVDGAERKCEIDLGNGIKLFGFIDRVDGCGDMIRIIDYKTGTIESNSGAYYMGIKLQLPLYLLSAARGKRPVGAYYFPAQIDYSSKEDGVFRLKGYMDGSDDVILNSDTTIEEKAKSKYFDAYYHSTQYSTESAMAQEDFIDFLQYSALVSRNGAKEMAQGNVKPSPYKQNKMKSACNFCKYFGSCHFVENLSGEMRETLSVNCKKIAQIVRKERGDED